MLLFQQLNRDQGITIVLVTHEDDIAAYAKRLIHLKDGHIIYDKDNNTNTSVDKLSRTFPT
jgi:putative ABC transport system ATP-binding protein